MSGGQETLRWENNPIYHVYYRCAYGLRTSRQLRNQRNRTVPRWPSVKEKRQTNQTDSQLTSQSMHQSVSKIRHSLAH